MADPGRHTREAVAQEQGHRSSLFLALGACTSLALLGIVALPVLRSGVASLAPAYASIAAAGVSLAGAALTWRGRPSIGAALSVAALAASYFFWIATFIGLGTLAATTFTFVAAAVVVSLTDSARIGRSLLFSLFGGYGLILSDLFWPLSRPAAPNVVAVVAWATGAGLVLLGGTIVLRRVHSYDLRTKLTGWFLIVALLPLVVLDFLNGRATMHALTDDANQRLFAAAKQTAVSIDDFIELSLRNTRTEARILERSGFFRVSESRRPGSEVEATALDLLRIFRDKDPLTISSYAILDRQGRVVLEFPAGEAINEADADYFQVPMETAWPYVSPVEFTPVAGGPFLYFSTPIFGREDQILGVLRVRYKAAILQQLVARSTGLVGGQSFAVLFDENLLHLAHGTEREAIFKLVADIPLDRAAELREEHRLPNFLMSEMTTDLPELVPKLQAAGSEPFFSARDVATGERINQVAVTTMRTQPWLVAFFQPQDVFLAPVQGQTRDAVLVAVAMTAVLIVAAMLLARFLSSPIRQLESAAARVARGELSVRAEVDSADEIGSLARTLNEMTDRLQESLQGSERRVAERTHALAVSAEVSRRLSTILDEQRLVAEVVNQVRRAFDYYQAQIYLMGGEGSHLVMAGGSGEPGRRMREAGHTIPYGQGLVGRAAKTNQLALVSDVTADPDWLANPLLPETKSEVAVPIAIGDDVLGVLDVQHNVEGGLTQEDADVLQSVANQVAVALQNARSYAQIERQAQQRALVNEAGRKIQHTKSMEEALQIAVREVGRAVNARYTGVRLFTKAQEKNGRSAGQDAPK